MNETLRLMVETGEIGFETVFELYAMLSVNHTRTVTNDMIEDEGIEQFIKHTGDITVERMTAESVDFALDGVPEMVADDLTIPRNENEQWLHYVIRAYTEQYVKESNSFQVMVS